MNVPQSESVVHALKEHAPLVHVDPSGQSLPFAQLGAHESGVASEFVSTQTCRAPQSVSTVQSLPRHVPSWQLPSPQQP